MATRIIEGLMKLLMQLMWKVVSYEDLKLGDHVYGYGFHGLYTHHGIYVGDGYVIHFTRTQSQKPICPSLSKTNHKQRICLDFPECENQETVKRGVVKTCLDCFRQDNERLRSLHRYEYGWPQLGFKLARRGTCTALPDTKLPCQHVRKARELHAKNAFGNYSLINNNCEHFATFCRTNIRRSEQTAFVSYCVRRIQVAKEWTASLLQRN